MTLTACTQNFDAFLADASSDGASDASDASDASSEASPSDAGALTFQCSGGSVSDCAQCSGAPIACVYCSQQSASQLAGRCIAQGSSCFQSAPSGFQLCSCQTASSCPEGDQVCRNGSCRTCGDSPFDVGNACQAGGTCRADGGCS